MIMISNNNSSVSHSNKSEVVDFITLKSRPTILIINHVVVIVRPLQLKVTWYKIQNIEEQKNVPDSKTKLN